MYNRLILPLMLIIISLPVNSFGKSHTGNIYIIESHTFTASRVDQAYLKYIKRSIKTAENDPEAKAVILKINTPGGMVVSAIDVKDVILNCRLPFYAFIKNQAISAGALIALSAKNIIMAEGSVIGDAAPVYIKKGKTVRAGEKQVSAIRAIFKTLAERSNRPVKIAKKMVDSDIVLTRRADGIDKAKGKLLTLTTKEAIRLKIADNVCNSINELLITYNLEKYKIVKLDFSITDELVSFFTHPIITSILLTLGMLGLIFEIRTPSWGVGGTVGILCLALFFLSQILGGHSNWGAPVLFIIGLILIVVEVFIIPGFGIVGFAGISAIVFSFIWAMGISNLKHAGMVVAASIIASFLLSILMFKIFPKTKSYSKMVLTNDESDFKSPTDHSGMSDLAGKTGTAVSLLRPAGIIEIDGKRINAVSDGSFIKSGSKITVLKAEGMRLIVKKI
ncbi:MAG: nodulation protein NfeD [Spirochaetes bacterium]|nr:nodulation protein NfeD [Spirochaetota bacterium]